MFDKKMIPCQFLYIYLLTASKIKEWMYKYINKVPPIKKMKKNGRKVLKSGMIKISIKLQFRFRISLVNYNVVQVQFSRHFLCTPNEETGCAELDRHFWDTLYNYKRI